MSEWRNVSGKGWWSVSQLSVRSEARATAVCCDLILLYVLMGAIVKY